MRQNQKIRLIDKQQAGSLSLVTPSNIKTTSTPKDELNFTTFPVKTKPTLKTDRLLTANLLQNNCNYAQSSIFYSDNEDYQSNSIWSQP